MVRAAGPGRTEPLSQQVLRVQDGRWRDEAFSIVKNGRAVHDMRRVFLAAMRWPRFVGGRRAGHGEGAVAIAGSVHSGVIVKGGSPNPRNTTNTQSIRRRSQEWVDGLKRERP